MMALLSFWNLPDQVMIWGVNVVLQVTCITLVSLLVSLWFKRNPTLRYWVFCFAMLFLLMVPALACLLPLTGNSWLTLSLGQEEVSEVNAQAELKKGFSENTFSATLDNDLGNESSFEPVSEIEHEHPSVPVEASQVSAQVNSIESTDGDSEVSEVALMDLPWWKQTLRWVLPPFIVVWLSVVFVLLLRMLVCWSRAAVVLHSAIPTSSIKLKELSAEAGNELGLNQLPEVLISNRITGPVSGGIFSPRILFPEEMIDQVPADQLRNILVHEYAHIVRRDNLVLFLQSLAVICFWFHPLVRMLSHQLATAREEVCDNYVLARTDAVSYSRTLLKIAELVQQENALPGTIGLFTSQWRLEHRVAGLLDENRNRRITLTLKGKTFVGSMLLLLCLLSAFGTVSLAVSESERAETAVEEPVEEPVDPGRQVEVNDAEYGPESHGLQCRLVAVSPDSDDESPDITKTTNSFPTSEKLTLVVELKNVSAQPVDLIGVRYGDSYPTALGKLRTEFIAPYLFDIQFMNEQGEQVARPEKVFLNNAISLSGSSIHSIDAGESLLVLLRPHQFMHPMNYVLEPGKYQVKVRYRGPNESTIDLIKKRKGEDANIWNHEVTSNVTGFSISPDPEESQPAALVWGPAKEGLRAAIEFQVPDHVEENPVEFPGIPLKTKVGVTFHVQNVSERPITFVSETGRQDDRLHLTDAEGEETKVRGVFFTGWPIDVRWNLKPGEIAQLKVLSPALDTITDPGKYHVRYSIRFGGRVSKDGQGNQIFPLEGDYQSELDTGTTPLFLRTRTEEDDRRAQPATFEGRIEFKDEQGNLIDAGVFSYRGELEKSELKENSFSSGTIRIPGCTRKSALISVRVPGYEQAYFNDINLSPDEVSSFTLKRSLPTKFRLVSSVDAQSISGATVRFFNKTSAKAASGPFPMKGIEGPVWARSDEEGRVRLESLQKISQYYKKLGDALYYFYIESNSNDIAPRFIGPVKAGQDLGDIQLGPYLELQGEVHGTAEELDRFSAEWDQPFELTSDNPEATWLYANSEKLKINRERDKLTFHLKRLRPGKIRIISDFSPRPHTVSHTYGRRDAKGNNVLIEYELKESVNNFVITPKGLQQNPKASSPVTTFTDGKFRLLPISGMVVGSNGKPLSGVSVFVRETHGGYQSDQSPRASKDLAFTRTDSEGRFRFESIPADRVDRRVDVVALAEGYAVGWRHLAGGIPLENVTLKLKPEEVLNGQIVDELGKPVSGAEVELDIAMSIRHITQADLEQGRWPRSDDGRYLKLRGFRAPPRAMSDSTGRFKLKGLPPQTGLMLKIRHDDYLIKGIHAATVSQIDKENAGKAKREVQTGNVKVALNRGRRLRLTVVDAETGKPVKGAWYAEMSRRDNRPPQFLTDATGVIDLKHLDRSTIQVDIYPPDGSDYLAHHEQLKFPPSIYKLTHTVKLSKGAIVSGKVVDAETGEGIPDMLINTRDNQIPRLLRFFPFPGDLYQTRADGSFRFAVPEGQTTIFLHRPVPGYRNVFTEDSKFRQQQVSASMEQPVTDLDFKLKRDPYIEGTVSDDQGNPAANVSVFGKVWLSPEGSLRTLRTLTDAQGFFRLKDAFDPGRYEIAPRSVELHFRDEKRNMGQLLMLDLPAREELKDQNLEVTLQPLGIARGRFVNAESGKPISGVRVALYKSELDPNSNSASSIGSEIRSDKAGRFEFAAVFGGATHSLSITDGRFLHYNGIHTRFTGKYDEVYDYGDIKLEPRELQTKINLPPARPPFVEGLSGESALEKLSRQYEIDYAAYRQALSEEKKEQIRKQIRVLREPTVVYAKQFQKLAEEHVDSDVELHCLIWLAKCRQNSLTTKELTPLKKAAVDRLRNQFLERKEISQCVSSLFYFFEEKRNRKEQVVELAEWILKANSHREVQAEVCSYVATHMLVGRYPGVEVKPEHRQIAIQYLKRIEKEFADLPQWRYGTLGAMAKRQLYELEHLQPGMTAPEITGVTIQGEKMSLSQYRGKVVVLLFWEGVDDPELKYGIPALNQLADEYQDDVVILGIVNDSQQQAKALLAEHKIGFANWLDPGKYHGPIAERWNITGTPTLHVLDQEGVIRHKNIQSHALRNVVWKLMKKKRKTL